MHYSHGLLKGKWVTINKVLQDMALQDVIKYCYDYCYKALWIFTNACKYINV